MTYQQARRIRNRDYSLKNLITRNIRSKDMGAGQAIKEAFREKFDVRTRLKAKVTGIKEKFDPLNIAKFLTFGSNVAPALLGKLTGRSKADIRNFTGGRQSYEDFGSPTATKIGKDPSVGSDMTGMSDVLQKILELQKRTYENIKEQRETKNNFQEERDLESQKRHNELLKAIKGFIPDGKQTAEKVTESGGLDMSSIIGAFGTANAARSALSLLAGLAASPIGVALVTAIIAGTVGAWMAKQIKEDPQAALEGKGGIGMAVAGLGSESQTATPTMDEETRKKLASGFDSKGLSVASLEELQAKKAEILDVGVDPRIKQQKGMTLDDVDKKRLKQINDIDAEIAKKQTTATSTGSTTATPVPSTTSTSGETTPTSTSNGGESTAAPTATTPPSQQLNAVTNENRDAKMNSMVTPSSSVTNNVMANNKPKQKTQKDSIPAVRNMEDTFQRMIYNSTRVI